MSYSYVHTSALKGLRITNPKAWYSCLCMRIVWCQRPNNRRRSSFHIYLSIFRCCFCRICVLLSLLAFAHCTHLFFFSLSLSVYNQIFFCGAFRCVFCAILRRFCSNQLTFHVSTNATCTARYIHVFEYVYRYANGQMWFTIKHDKQFSFK